MADCGVQLVLLAVLSLCSMGVAQPPPPLRIPTVTISGGGASAMTCPRDDALAMARMNSTAGAQTAFRNSPCGGPGWFSLFNLDMTDPSQTCPPAWTMYANPRSCSTAATATGCASLVLPSPVSGTYTKVCGRARAYGTGSPDAFFHGTNTDLEGTYIDGISLTYGMPRTHIFSFPAGNSGLGDVRCPCHAASDPVNAPVPSFVGNNYFCDTNANGALFDGLDCVTPCCTFNNPPYFNVTLPAPTSANIEVRICANQPRGNEAVSLDQMEIYIQ